ncbi:unnamed protein product [Meganyctiphanes norvegica]|uniref:SET domain-containing protein n=1 Tax=Meganyctiphanes norvegica TaxID=48144 RepID=A0AAV2ST97_MEGNR
MEGFSCQPLLDRITHVMVKTGAIRDFAKLKDSIDQVRYCFTTELQYDRDIKFNIMKEVNQLAGAFYDKCADHGKDEEMALQAKSKGSRAYLKKRDSEAHEEFTKCLRLAPQHSNLVSLAYANRSAVLFQMARYTECIQDIKCAELANYPDILLHKILVRRMWCYLHMGNIDAVNEALISCKQYLGKVPEQAKEKFESSILEIETALKNNKVKTDYREANIIKDAPELHMGESTKLKYMSSAFELKESLDQGRHIVAGKDIPKGNVVFTEKPYAAILLPEYHLSHCHTCCAPAMNPVPCPGCRDAIFCDEDCLSQSRSWHQYECQLLHILSIVGIAHLALRVLLVAGWDLCQEVLTESPPSGVGGVSSNGIYNGNTKKEKYRSVYHLMPHLTNVVPEDLVQYSVAGLLLTTVLGDKTDFIINAQKSLTALDKKEVSYEDACCRVAVVAMRHIAQLVSNAHAITQIMPQNKNNKSKVEQVNQKRVASAIYPSASLMNHSCQPNILNSFRKDILVIHSTKDIKTGDQIYNCYGPHFNRQTREERQKALKMQYFFTCKCLPCTDASYIEREARWTGFVCDLCNGCARWIVGEESDGIGVLSCLTCHTLEVPPQHLVNICTQVNEIFDEGEEALQKSNALSAVMQFQKAISLATGVYLPENEYYINMQDQLARALGEMGDYNGCCQELRKGLNSTKKRFGTESVEYGHELLKFCDALKICVIDNNQIASELASVEKELDKIFSINYGVQWQKYLKLS